MWTCILRMKLVTVARKQVTQVRTTVRHAITVRTVLISAVI